MKSVFWINKHFLWILKGELLMEFNTNERLVNKEVVEILSKPEPAEAFEGTIKEGAGLKYIVVNTRDIRLYADNETTDDFFCKLNILAESIEEGRFAAGKKPFNNYIVINIDEPYSNDIVAILQSNGHWDGKKPDAKNILNDVQEAAELHLQTILELQRIRSMVHPIGDPIAGSIGVALSELEEKFHRIHDKWSDS